MDVNQKFAHLVADYETGNWDVVLNNLYLMLCLGWQLSMPTWNQLKSLNNHLSHMIGVNIQELLNKGMFETVIDAIRNK